MFYPGPPAVFDFLFEPVEAVIVGVAEDEVGELISVDIVNEDWDGSGAEVEFAVPFPFVV